MSKRITALLLCCVMFFGTLVPVHAADAVQFKVVADETATRGDTVSVTVSIGAVASLGVLEFKLVIPEGMTIVDSSISVPDDLAETLDSDGDIVVPAAKNSYKWSYSAQETGYAGTADLVLVTFDCTVNDDAAFDSVQEITINVTDCCDNVDIESLEFDVTAAEVTVVCPHNDTELINVQAPTCNDDGYTGDLYCNDCEKTIEEGETDPATGKHVDDNGEWEYDDDEHFYTCGCGEKFDNADHNYNKSIVDEAYLNTEATCTAKATYFKSCICGKAGTDTFETGKKLEHTYDQEVTNDTYLKSAATCEDKAVYYKSCVCGAKGKETFEYGETLPHTYDKEVATSKYLSTPATCTEQATYFKSCVCGLASETETFASGALAKHVYDKEVATEAYLKTPATCEDKAVYYKSCVCGEKGTKTFIYGETTPHVYDQEVVAKKYLKSEATCMAEALYFKSCVCGLASETASFVSGYKDPDNHISDGSEMEYDEDSHWGTCDCGAQLKDQPHKGGEATCAARAVCSVCGAAYGELDIDNHGETEVRGAVEASCTEDGYTGDTYCKDCDTRLTQGKAIPAGHKWDKGVVTLEPTEETEGTKLFTCEICGETKEETLPVKSGKPAITPANPEAAEPFDDVDKSDWFYNDVVYVYENGLMNGTGAEAFSPEMTTDRAMIVTVLWRLEGSPIVDSDVDFSDVADGLWYSDAIDWASANGIVNGYGNGMFGPTDQITREQVMLILNRYAAYKGWTEDVAVTMIAQYTCSIWAENGVNWADLNGLLADLGVDVSDMTAKASRAELAAYLSRFMQNVAK